MKTLYQTLQALIKEPPQFQPGLMVMKCPEFLVNAFLAKHGDASHETGNLYGNKQPVGSKQ